VVRPHAPTAAFPAHLRALYDRFPFDRSLADDPIRCVRPYAGDLQSGEIAGIVAATLAIGNTTAIRRAFAELERQAGGELRRWVDGADGALAGSELRGFRHRWVRGDQLHFLARTLRSIYRGGATLEMTFLDGFESGGFAGGVDALAHRLRAGPGGGARPPPGYVRLFPTPLHGSGSPCKRLTLFVRWMVRPGFPDVGLWRRVPTGELRIPLDQHVHWIAYHLGLTRRRTRSWATVEEVTEALRRIDPVDPVRFDFVLCHTGVSGDCPKRKDPVICGPCSVRPDCDLWRVPGRSVA